jgi:hypothetical protein
MREMAAHQAAGARGRGGRESGDGGATRQAAASLMVAAGGAPAPLVPEVAVAVAVAALQESVVRLMVRSAADRSCLSWRACLRCASMTDPEPSPDGADRESAAAAGMPGITEQGGTAARLYKLDGYLGFADSIRQRLVSSAGFWLAPGQTPYPSCTFYAEPPM